MKKIYHISFRCYYEAGNYTQHYQDLPLKDIEKWIEAYRFTHPDCVSVTIQVVFNREGNI